jgi:hypothetical protein
MLIRQGQFVEARGRPWLVEAVDDREPDLTTLKLSYIADDAQGEQIEVLWGAAMDRAVLEAYGWYDLARAPTRSSSTRPTRTTTPIRAARLTVRFPRRGPRPPARAQRRAARAEVRLGIAPGMKKMDENELEDD